MERYKVIISVIIDWITLLGEVLPFSIIFLISPIIFGNKAYFAKISS